jgi:hypothetical protein
MRCNEEHASTKTGRQKVTTNLGGNFLSHGQPEKILLMKTQARAIEVVQKSMLCSLAFEPSYWIARTQRSFGTLLASALTHGPKKLKSM